MYIANADRYRDMIYRRCGQSGILLPAVSIGLWHNFGGVDALDNGRAMLRRAFDRCASSTSRSFKKPEGLDARDPAGMPLR